MLCHIGSKFRKSVKGLCCLFSGMISSHRQQRQIHSFCGAAGDVQPYTKQTKHKRHSCLKKPSASHSVSHGSNVYGCVSLCDTLAVYSGTIKSSIANRIGSMNWINRLRFPYPQRRIATDVAIPRTVSVGVKYRICCQTEVSATISLSTLTIKIKGNS